MLERGKTETVSRDIGAGPPDWQGCRGPDLIGVKVVQINRLANRVSHRIVRPRRDLIFAAVFRPDMARSFGRDLKSEIRVGNDVDPGCRGGFAVPQDRHIFAPLIGEAAGAVKELQRGQYQVWQKRSWHRGRGFWHGQRDRLRG